MMKFSKLFRKRKAVTLIELIMAIVVVGIIAVPISVTLSKHVQSVFISQDYTIALDLARYEMEVILNTAYANITSATLNSFQGYPYNVIVTVTYAQGTALTAESLKLVNIQVTKSGSATVLVSLNTYVSKNIIWGL